MLNSQSLKSTQFPRRPWLLLPIVVGIFCLSLPASAIPQEMPSRVLTVQGQGRVEIPTNLTRVSLGVEVEGKTAQEVQDEIARRSSAVVELVRSRQVKKLQTTGIQLQPIYVFENNKRRQTGYTGNNSISFQIQTERAGTLLDEAIAAGATRIDGVSFIASEETINTAREQALQEATKDAQQQAKVVLDTLGLTQKEILTIQINSVNIPAPIPFQQNLSFAKARAEDVSTPVVGGEQEINANISLQIRY